MEAKLIGRRAAANILGISYRHFINLEMDGKLPKTRLLGRRRLFSVAEIETWIAKNCPAQTTDVQL